MKPTVTTSPHNVIKILQYALQRAADKKIPQIAASLTYTSVLGLVPFLAVVLSLFTAFPLFADFQEALEQFLADNLMPPAVSDNIMAYLNQFAEKATGLTAVGSLALIVTSIMLLRTVDDAFNNLWNVKKQRPLRQRVLVYWAIISLGPILTGASLWASALLARRSAEVVEGLPVSVDIALSLFPLIATILGFAVLFFIVPNRGIRWRDALIGATVTALLLTALREGFAYYLTRFPSYTIIYGAFATIPIFLLWIYLSWLVILAGAMLTSILPSIRQRRWAQTHYAGDQFIDALKVLQALWNRDKDVQPRLGVAALRTQTNIQEEALNSILNQLQILGYTVNNEETGKEVWLLACDPRQASLTPLINTWLLDQDHPDVRNSPEVRHALAYTLLEHPITLENLIERPHTLSQIPDIGQNEGNATIKSTGENNHA